MRRWVGLVALLAGVGLLACGEEGEGSTAPMDDGGGAGGQGGAGGGAGEGGSGGGGGGGAGGTGGTAGSGGGEGPAPAVRRLTPRLAGIVDPQVAMDVEAKLFQEQGSQLHSALGRFYERFPDAFDFVFFFGEAGSGSAAGIHVPMNRPAIPGTGVDHPWADPNSPSRRVKSAIALRLASNGPTLHEVMHYWAVNLSPELGFSRSHWHNAGVHGQLGGFDPETLVCVAEPEVEPSECKADEESGLTTFLVENYGQVANGGDSIPYAPLELYLMGLVPAEEVPPIPIFEEVVVDIRIPESSMREIGVESLRIVTIEDIIAKHGERQAATEEERSFSAAFVLVTAEEPTQEQLDMADNWVATFGCETSVSYLYCFDDATGGLATMTVALPEVDD